MTHDALDIIARVCHDLGEVLPSLPNSATGNACELYLAIDEVFREIERNFAIRQAYANHSSCGAQRFERCIYRSARTCYVYRGINAETGRLCTEAGANVLVAGSYVFNGDLEKNVKRISRKMKDIIETVE